MKKKIAFVVVILGVVLMGIPFSKATLASPMFSIGEKLRQTDTTFSDSTAIVAAYNGHIIAEEDIEYQLYIDSLRPTESKAHYSRKNVIDNLLLGYIILDEARDAGLTIGSDEVRNSVELSKEALKQSPEASTEIQDFCAGANITMDEYWVRVEERLNHTLLNLKYENLFIDDYMENHPDAEYQDALDCYDQHKQELLQKHTDEIVYYDDVAIS